MILQVTIISVRLQGFYWVCDLIQNSTHTEDTKPRLGSHLGQMGLAYPREHPILEECPTPWAHSLESFLVFRDTPLMHFQASLVLAFFFPSKMFFYWFRVPVTPVLLDTVNLTQTRSTWKEFSLSNCLYQVGLWTSLRSVTMIIYVGGLSPLWVAPFPGQVILYCIQKLAKHEPENEWASKHDSSKVSAYSSCPNYPQ